MREYDDNTQINIHTKFFDIGSNTCIAFGLIGMLCSAGIMSYTATLSVETPGQIVLAEGERGLPTSTNPDWNTCALEALERYGVPYVEFVPTVTPVTEESSSEASQSTESSSEQEQEADESGASEAVEETDSGTDTDIETETTEETNQEDIEAEEQEESTEEASDEPTEEQVEEERETSSVQEEVDEAESIEAEAQESAEVDEPEQQAQVTKVRLTASLLADVAEDQEEDEEQQDEEEDEEGPNAPEPQSSSEEIETETVSSEEAELEATSAEEESESISSETESDAGTDSEIEIESSVAEEVSEESAELSSSEESDVELSSTESSDEPAEELSSESSLASEEESEETSDTDTVVESSEEAVETTSDTVESSESSEAAEPVLDCSEFSFPRLPSYWEMPYQNTIIRILFQMNRRRVWQYTLPPEYTVEESSSDQVLESSSSEGPESVSDTETEASSSSAETEPEAEAEPTSREKLAALGIAFSTELTPWVVDEEGLPVATTDAQEVVYLCMTVGIVENEDGDQLNCNRYRDGKEWQWPLEDTQALVTYYYNDRQAKQIVQLPENVIGLTQDQHDLWLLAAEEPEPEEPLEIAVVEESSSETSSETSEELHAAAEESLDSARDDTTKWPDALLIEDSSSWELDNGRVLQLQVDKRGRVKNAVIRQDHWFALGIAGVDILLTEDTRIDALDGSTFAISLLSASSDGMVDLSHSEDHQTLETVELTLPKQPLRFSKPVLVEVAVESNLADSQVFITSEPAGIASSSAEVVCDADGLASSVQDAAVVADGVARFYVCQTGVFTFSAPIVYTPATAVSSDLDLVEVVQTDDGTAALSVREPIDISQADTNLHIDEGTEIQGESPKLEEFILNVEEGEEETETIVEFGIPNKRLTFTKPVKVVTATDLEDGTEVELEISYFDDEEFQTTGITTDPEATCIDGRAVPEETTAVVENGEVVFYACGS